MANILEEWKEAQAKADELEDKLVARIDEIQVLLHKLYKEKPAASWYFPSHDCNMDYPCEVGLKEAMPSSEKHSFRISWFDEENDYEDGVEVYPRHLTMTDEEITAEWHAENAKALEEERKRKEKELKKKAAKEKKEKKAKATLEALKKKLTKEELKALNLK